MVGNWRRVHEMVVAETSESKSRIGRFARVIAKARPSPPQPKLYAEAAAAAARNSKVGIFRTDKKPTDKARA